MRPEKRPRKKVDDDYEPDYNELKYIEESTNVSPLLNFVVRLDIGLSQLTGLKR